jgi:hypothetical protein
VFFAEFLATTGVFDPWVSECPLAYRSGNAPDKRDVLGTLMLGLLAGCALVTLLPRRLLAKPCAGSLCAKDSGGKRGRAVDHAEAYYSAGWRRSSSVAIQP